MTDVMTGTCTSCGADLYGTKFCETCGAPVVVGDSEPEVSQEAMTSQPAQPAEPAPLAAASSVTESVAPSESRGGTALRVIELFFLLSTILVPSIIQVLPATDNEYQLQLNTLATLQVFTGFFALLAAVAGHASGGAKFGGAILALGYVALTMTQDFTSVLYVGAVGFPLFDVLGYLLLFLCWAVARPFRGPGYFGILFVVVFGLVNQYIALGIDQSAPEQAPVLVALIDTALILATIGFSALFELSRVSTPSAVAANADGPVNGKARASLTMALVAIGLNIISRLIPYTLGVTISVCAVGLLIAAIIVGHLARREIRSTNQRGTGLATTGLVIGYVILGLDLALIVVAIGAIFVSFASL